MMIEPEVDREDLAGRRVTILGLGRGRTAAPLARFLLRAGARVTVADAKPADLLGEGLGRLEGLEVTRVLGPSGDDEALADPDFVFVVPGIRADAPTLRRAAERGIPILTEMGLFLRICPAPVVGITGTKGKTTTTTMIGRILQHTGKRVIVGGNIGNALIDAVDDYTPDDIVVLELSSFQLAPLRRSPHVAVVTMVGEDHLDVHGSREAYVSAKRNIVAWQGSRDIAVLNLDDPATVALHTGASSETRGFSLNLRPRHGARLDEDGRLVLVSGQRRRALCFARELKVDGRHNIANALAAAAVGDAFDVAADLIGDVLRNFEGVPHRQEAVGTANGVLYVNNSQGTTPASAITAVASYDRPAVAILGGRPKGSDFREMADALVARGRGAILIGEAADAIAADLRAATAAEAKHDFRVERATSLEAAVAQARAMARPGDVVLLSPACASFDMFSSYEERGDRFRAAVRAFADAAA